MIKLTYLGNLVGSSSTFGYCPKCGAQHMSTHDRVQTVTWHWHPVCAKCAS